MKTISVCMSLLLLVLTGCVKPASLKEERRDQRFYVQRTGASARDLLSDIRFTALRVEIQYMSGFAPDETAVNNLKVFLYEHLHKPDGIGIFIKEIKASEDSVTTIDQIIALERSNRTAFNSGKTITLYILYTNGYYTQSNMLGYAYRNTSAVLFGKNLHENSNLPKKRNRTYLETRVLQHEVAHLLGLVNTGTPLQSDHKDAEHGKHCLNKKCLMYYLTDIEDPTSLILKKEVPKLDEACLRDLLANGGREEEPAVLKQHLGIFPFSIP